MECGGQCVIMDGIVMMLESCADSWDFLDQVLICTVLSVVVMYWNKGHVHIANGIHAGNLHIANVPGKY